MGQRRIKDAPGIERSRKPTGVFQCVHLGVQDGTATLHRAIVSAADNCVVVRQNGADRNATFG